MARPRKKDRTALTTYNISIETANILDKMKQKGENQDDLISRLISNSEEYKHEIENYKWLREDDGRTMIDLRKKIAHLEIKSNDSRRVEQLI